MTSVDIKELKELLAAGTPGPIRLMDGDPLSVDFHAAVYAPKMTGATPVTKLAANAALIVALRNNAEALIAVAEAAEMLVVHAEKMMSQADDGGYTEVAATDVQHSINRLRAALKGGEA